MRTVHIREQNGLDKLCAKLFRKKSGTSIRLRLPPQSVGPGWETQLSQALENSTIVAGLHFDLALMSNPDTVKALLPYLRTNRHLRKLALPPHTGADPDRTVFAEQVRLVLNAASENDGIEELFLGVVEPVESIVKVIQGTKPRVLTFARTFTALKWNIIGQALKTNPGLQTLTVHQVDHVLSLLQHLESHKTLESLILGKVLEPWQTLIDGQILVPSLASFVAATTSVLKLKLHGFNFSATIEPLVEALKVNQSVNSFALWNSSFCPQAAGELSNFFQSGDATTNGIKHLELKNSSTYRLAEGELVVAFLGPSLDSLTFTNDRWCILTFLVASGAVNRMPPHWHVKKLYPTGAMVLARLLPHATNLSDLDLSFTYRQDGGHSPMNQLLSALQKNWSLTRISLKLDNGEPYCKKDDDLKMIEAYCARNAEAPALLCGPAPSQDEESTVRRLVAPSLFALMAVQASSIHGALRLLFKGVFAMGAEAGSGRCRATKRARSNANPRRDTNTGPNKKRAATMDTQGKPFAQPTEYTLMLWRPRRKN